MGKYFEINNLVLDFKTIDGDFRALNIDHLDIDNGESFGIVGESGAGKTVLALTILGLLPPTAVRIRSGEILLEGTDLLKLGKKELMNIRGKKIAMIFQDPMSSLNPVFTIGRQMEDVIRCHRKISRANARAEAIKAIETVRLPDAESCLGKYPHQLSGGQRQRIVIALALSCKADFLIADEPTRNLDVTIQAGILKLIDELRKELGITVLYISNNFSLASVVCSRIAVLRKGSIVECGAREEIIGHPQDEYTKLLLKVGE
ncbi:MAG: ABC transporter ATP-binding protein [Clostridiaceae bacterium]|nr:ABC transporter ATP-binding protein [Eubacteriales bacterium]